MKQKIIDLHSHTTASDGSLSPSDLVLLANNKGLSALAITDHDTVSGIKEAIEKAAELGDIEVIPGVEISADYSGEIHILGYFLNIHDKDLKSSLEDLRRIRDLRNSGMIKKFEKHNIKITIEELHGEAKGESIARPHFANILVNKGLVKDHKTAFNKYLGDESGICFVPKEKIHPEKAISIIRNAGGIAVLAHPVHLKYKTRTKLKNFLYELKDFGLSGLEVFHPDHSEINTKLYLDMANDIGLCITGGSDYHGKFKPYVDIGVGRGNLSVPYELLEKLKIECKMLSESKLIKQIKSID